jgi:hypothetical protein
VKKRGHLIEKQKAHEKIGQLWELNPKITTNVMGHDKKIGHLWTLDPGNVSNQIGQHKKFGKHTRVPVIIGEN